MKTETKTQHTPTPWVYDGEFISPCKEANNRFSVTGEPILEVEDSPNWEANAAFIVRAVNSHEALLEAAKIGLSYMSPGEDITIYGIDIVTVKKAIAQAQAEKAS